MLASIIANEMLLQGTAGMLIGLAIIGIIALCVWRYHRARPDLLVMAHRAFFVLEDGGEQEQKKNTPTGPVWFVKVTNMTDTMICITHVSCMRSGNTRDVSVCRVQGRALPTFILPRQQIEWWIPEDETPVCFGPSGFEVVDSRHRVYRSVLNDKVPGFGTVAH